MQSKNYIFDIIKLQNKQNNSLFFKQILNYPFKNYLYIWIKITKKKILLILNFNILFFQSFKILLILAYIIFFIKNILK